MICDNCTKNKVCKYKENCNILERDVVGSKIENIITLEIRCSQYNSIPTNFNSCTNAQIKGLSNKTHFVPDEWFKGL